MIYKIIKHYPNGVEALCAEFNDLDDAKLFIKARLLDDTQKNEKVVYHLTNGDVFLEAHFQSTAHAIKTFSADRTESEIHTEFRPTPFSTTPIPPGFPDEWLVNVDPKSEKDKK